MARSEVGCWRWRRRVEVAVREATSPTHQVFPNQFSRGARVGSVVAAGVRLSISGAADTFVSADTPRTVLMHDRSGGRSDQRLPRVASIGERWSTRRRCDGNCPRARVARDGAPPIEAVGIYNYEIIP